jgi:hypothetical protein
VTHTHTQTHEQTGKNMTVVMSECKIRIAQMHGIQYFTLVVCLVSVLSTMFVFCAYVIYRREARHFVRRFNNSNLRMRILLYMNLFGLLYGTVFFIQSILVSVAENRNGKGYYWFYTYPYCQIQAALTNWSSLALNTWSLCFTIHLYFQLTRSKSFSQLRKLFRRLEWLFIVLTVFIIPIPFFIMIFKLPLLGTDRWILLYGKQPGKHWCDFANMPARHNNYNTSRSNIETHWSIFWEIGFVYVPNISIFIASMLLYGRVVYTIRQNSKQLHKNAELIRQYSSDNLAAENQSFSTNSADDELDETITVDVGPIHAPFALKDYDQYMKFLQLQANTASYYIIAFSLNWIIWIAARLVWEFAECSDSSNISPYILKASLIILECSGPRIDCLILSIIYGLAENTATPKNFEEFVTNSLLIPFLKEHCSRAEKRDKDIEYGFLSSLLFCFKNKKTMDFEEKSYLLDKHRGGYNHGNSKLESETILYFWYDVQKCKEKIYLHKALVKQFRKQSLSTKLNSDMVLFNTLQKLDATAEKVYKYSKDIFSTYFATDARLPLHAIITHDDLKKLQNCVENGFQMFDIRGSSQKNTSRSNRGNGVIEIKVRDYEHEFEVVMQYGTEIRKLLFIAEQRAEQHLQTKVKTLITSSKIDEIQMTLRMKSQGSSRSIYRDVLERSYSLIVSLLHKMKSCVPILVIRKEAEKNDQKSNKGHSSRLAEDKPPRTIDPAIYAYIKSEKRYKLQNTNNNKFV